MTKIITLLPYLVGLSAHATSLNTVRGITDSQVAAIGCPQVESRTWDSLNQYLLDHNQVPTLTDLQAALPQSLHALHAQGQNLNTQQNQILTQDLQDLYQLLLVDAPTQVQAKTPDDVLSLLSALELGDRTTLIKQNLQVLIQKQFAQLKKDAADLHVDCAAPFSTLSENSPLAFGSLHPAVGGTRLSMATAYQTCEALALAPLDNGSPTVDGISIVGVHNDGIGKKRVISNVGELERTDPYYKDVSSYGASCLNAKNYPLIYNYGGRPFATTGSGGTLNFFKEAGTGTHVLGVDCSGFVYTGLAASGLRVTPGSDMKATGVYGISSDMFVEPENNNMSCLQKISVTSQSTLHAGDIVAIYGHVVMIDSVGSDPFGISNAGSATECSNLQASGFDFVIIQSDPSFGGIGINRYKASDYLYNDSTMREGMEKYAYYACLAHFKKTTYTPNLGKLSVIRHNLSSSCMGNRVKLEQESCVQDCSELH